MTMIAAGVLPRSNQIWWAADSCITWGSLELTVDPAIKTHTLKDRLLLHSGAAISEWWDRNTWTKDEHQCLLGVTFGGRLYREQSGCQRIYLTEPFAASGGGCDFATGALAAVYLAGRGNPASEDIQQALEVACRYAAGCSAPVKVWTREIDKGLDAGRGE